MGEDTKPTNGFNRRYKKLTNFSPEYQLRIGKYRVLFAIHRCRSNSSPIAVWFFILKIPRRLRRGQDDGGFQRGRGVALAPLVVGEVSYLVPRFEF